MTSICVLFCSAEMYYCHKVSAYLGEKHPNVKVSIVGDISLLEQTAHANMCNVILIGEEFAAAPLNYGGGAAVAYLTSTDMGKQINGKRAFCKYRSGETIYKQILSLYSEVSAAADISKSGGMTTYAFVNANGGAGATTAACALAYRLAGAGKRVLYLDLDKLSDMSQLLSDNTGIGDMSDLITYTLSATSKTYNLNAKAAALLLTDSTGVRFVKCSRLACDMDELDEDGIRKLYNSVVAAEPFDAVIIDGSIYDSRMFSLITENANRIVVMSENNSVANTKLVRIINMFRAYGARRNNDYLNMLSIVINRTSESGWGGKRFEGAAVLGSIPKYNDANPRNVTVAVSKLDMWKLLSVGG